MRLIDADALKEKLPQVFIEASCRDCPVVRGFVGLGNLINDAPTIDAEPVVHGHWIDAYPDIEPNPMFMYGICSNCGFEQGISSKLNYCPNCGVKMDEVSE